MSLAVVLSRGLAGLDAPLVNVEVHAGNGLPGINLVGLPETEVKEARDRVRAALQNAQFAQFDFPARKITVQWLYNLGRALVAPARPHPPGAVRTRVAGLCPQNGTDLPDPLSLQIAASVPGALATDQKR